MLVHIKDEFERSRHTYGCRRVHVALGRRRIRCGLHRVGRLMRLGEMVAVQRRKYRHTTDSRHDYPVAPDLLGRDFRVERPDRVWVADISYIPTDEGWLYLATELDLCTHRVIGWSLGSRLDRGLVLGALEMALGRRRPRPGLIHHSDRGVQYACGDCQRLLNDHGLICSMSRKGDPYDNAVAESFFKTLKVELVYRRRFRTRREAKAAIVEYIEVFYNRERQHSSLGYLSPAEYEERLQTA
jgi:transposase InsO family protein